MTRVEENCRIVLKNIPFKLQRHAIENLLRTFGTLIDFNIPNNQETFRNKPGFRMAFAEFSKFSEAETAMCKINNSKNKGFSIRAEFAHSKSSVETEVIKPAEPTFKGSDALKAWDEPQSSNVEVKQVDHAPLTVLYDVEPNDVYERVTAFHRKKAPVSFKTEKQMETYKKLVNQSKGSYDKEKDRFTYNERLLNIFPKQKCAECQNEGLLQCEETSLFYCSIKCSLITAEEPDSASPVTIAYGRLVKLNDKVIICGIINEKCIYVRSSESDFGWLQNEIYKIAKNAPKLREFPEVGNLVLVESFGERCRAKVLDVSDDDGYAISVQLIDYGSTARVFFDDLMAMSPALRKLKCITHKLILKDVKLEAIHTDVIEYMVQLQTDKTELTVTALNGDEAVLVAKPSYFTVNQSIMNLSVVKGIELSDDGVYFSDYPPQAALLSKTNKKVFVVNTCLANDPEFICCISEDNVKDFRELYKAINVFGNSLKSKTSGLPKHEDQVCLVFVNNQWHRGIKEKTDGDGFPQFLLYDQYCYQKVSVNNIVPMPRAFMLPPPVIEICRIKDYENEKVKLAKETINAGEMTVVKEIEEVDGAVVLTIA